MGNFFRKKHRPQPDPPPVAPQPLVQRDERDVEENGNVQVHPDQIPNPVLEQGGQVKVPADSPIGRTGYLLEDAPAVNIKRTSSLKTHTVVEPLAVEIRDRYQDIAKLYQAVNTYFCNFKAALGEPPEAELTACFAKIKQESRAGSQINISYEGRRLVVHVGEDAMLNEQVERAIDEFKLMLDNMYALMDKKDDVCSFVDEKLREMRGLCRSQADLQLYETVQCLPEEVKKFTEKMQNLEHDIPIAKEQLRDKPMTGLLMVLPADRH